MASLTIGALGVLTGATLYWRAMSAPPARPFQAALWAWAALAIVASALSWQRLRARGASAGLRTIGGVFLPLTPSALLLSVPATCAVRLGATHPWTLAALVVVALLPLGLALGAARVDEASLSRWRGNALTAAASTCCVLLALELGTRLIGADPGPALPRFRETPFRTARSTIPRVGWELAPDQTWKTIYPSNERGYFDADGSVSYRTNDTGYRGDNFSLERAPGVRRVALVGDSFAFGLGVKEHDTLARRLEADLTEGSACRTEVLNFAVPGYSTDQEEALVRRRVLRYAPDVTVVWYFLNDVEIEGTLAFLGGDEPRGFFPLARRWSALARLVGHRLDAALSLFALVQKYSNAYRPSDPHWRVVQQAFDRMGRTAGQRGARVVVFIHPILFRLGPSYPFAAIHRQVIEAAERAGLTAYDLRDAFAGHQAEELWVHRSDQHPNQIAHALAARFAAERLRPLLPACSPGER